MAGRRAVSTGGAHGAQPHLAFITKIGKFLTQENEPWLKAKQSAIKNDKGNQGESINWTEQVKRSSAKEVRRQYEDSGLYFGHQKVWHD